MKAQPQLVSLVLLLREPQLLAWPTPPVRMVDGSLENPWPAVLTLQDVN